MSQTSFLYIDGENLRNYVKRVLEDEGLSPDNPGVENFNYPELFNQILKGVDVAERRFYSAKLSYHPSSPAKSLKLVRKQRILKSHLDTAGFTFISSGSVRGQEVEVNGKKRWVFKEKGVDVRIAVDLVADSCDNKVATVILCSSDSDLLPAVREIRSRGIKVIYVGFEYNPNKGLSYNCDRTILIRNSEIVTLYK